MASLPSWLIQFVSERNNPAGLAILAGAAFIEYVFPPFPGDTITLFGAVLITARGWSFGWVFGAVMLGAIAGSALDYWVGLRLGRLRPAAVETRRQALLARLVDRFQRHGTSYLLLSRFIPGVRPLFFVAAAMAGIPPLRTLALGAVSSLLWNLGMIAVGSLLGSNFDALVDLVERYTAVVWIALAVIVVGAIALKLYRRRRPPVA